MKERVFVSAEEFDDSIDVEIGGTLPQKLALTTSIIRCIAEQYEYEASELAEMICEVIGNRK